MELPKRWLIATDGSKYATLSVEYAANLYKQLKEKPQVLLLNVIPKPNAMPTEGEPIPVQSKQVLQEAKELFNDGSDEADTVETLTAIGDPRKVIVDIAKNHKIEHIIMGGSDFRWKVSDLLTGGISNYIIHHLQCTITIIK